MSTSSDFSSILPSFLPILLLHLLVKFLALAHICHILSASSPCGLRDRHSRRDPKTLSWNFERVWLGLRARGISSRGARDYKLFLSCSCCLPIPCQQLPRFLLIPRCCLQLFPPILLLKIMTGLGYAWPLPSFVSSQPGVSGSVEEGKGIHEKKEEVFLPRCCRRQRGRHHGVFEISFQTLS